MAGTVEKKIRVEIEAILKGLKDAKDFQNVLRELKKQGTQKFNLDTGKSESNAIKLITVLRQLSPAADSAAGKVEGVAKAVGGGGGLLATLGPLAAVLGVATGATVGLGAGLFALVKHAADTGARFNDLSLKTGVSVETLSGLDLQLRQSGSSLETFSNGVIELQKNLGGAAGGNKELARTFAQLGITDADAALRDTDGTLRQVLKSLFAIKDEGVRNAVGAQVLGRAYKELAVFVSDAGGDIDAVVEKARRLGLVMSAEAAAAADKFGDDLEQLESQLASLGRELGEKLLPEATRGVEALSNLLRDNKPAVNAFFDAIVSGLIRTGEQAKQTYNDFAPFLRRVTEANTRANEIIEGGFGPRGPVSFGGNIFDAITGKQVGANFIPSPNSGRSIIDLAIPLRPPAPAGSRKFDFGGGRKGRGGGADKGAQAEKQLQDSILALKKAFIETSFDLDKDSFDRQQKLLEDRLEDQTISIKDYYAERLRLQLEANARAVRHEEELRAVEREKLEQSKAEIEKKKDLTPGQKAKEIQAARNKAEEEFAKINERIAVLKREQVDLTAQGARDTKKAVEELDKQIAAVQNELLEQQGRSFESAVRKIREQFKDLREKAVANFGKDSEQVLAIDAVIRFRIDKEKFADVMKSAQQQLDQLRIEEDRIDAAQRLGGLSDEEARRLKLQAQRQIRQEVQDELAGLRRIAEVTKDPELLAAVQRLGVEVGQLGVQIDEVARHINEDLKQSFKDTAFDIIRHTKTVGEAFRDLADHILDEMARLASDNIIEMLFGENGIFSGVFKGEGGIGGIFSTIFNKKPAGNPQPAGGGTVTVFDPGKLPGVIKNFQGTTTGGFTSVKQATDGVRSEVSSSVGKVGGKMDEIITFLPNLLPAGQSLGRDLLLKAIQLAGTIASAKVAKQGQPHAAGGLITGEGTGTSDSILARLSNGEFVIRASSVRSIGAGALEYINDVGRLPRYALGGLIGDMPAIQIQGGAGPVVLNQSVSINTRDAQSFRQSEQQIKRDLSRATLDGINRASSRPR